MRSAATRGRSLKKQIRMARASRIGNFYRREAARVAGLEIVPTINRDEGWAGARQALSYSPSEKHADFGSGELRTFEKTGGAGIPTAYV